MFTANLQAKFLPLAHLHLMTAHQHFNLSMGFQLFPQVDNCLTHPATQFPPTALGAEPPSYSTQVPDAGPVGVGVTMLVTTDAAGVVVTTIPLEVAPASDTYTVTVVGRTTSLDTVTVDT